VVKLAEMDTPHITQKILITQPQDYPKDPRAESKIKEITRILSNTKAPETATDEEKITHIVDGVKELLGVWTRLEAHTFGNKIVINCIRK
jgi:hypothetical protein